MSTVIALLDPRARPGARERARSGRFAVPSPWRRERRSVRRSERRRLERQDVVSGRLAELQAIGALLGQAARIVEAGWVQGAWFTVATSAGDRAVTAYDLDLARTQPVIGACLVGAVVHAAGGPDEVRSQVVQRTLDLAWHALREGPGRPVRWCPGPCVRTMHVLELTFWNDAAGRTQREVVDLLLAARQVADVQGDVCRSEQAGPAVVAAVVSGRS